jgi:hypothetical protein
MDLQLFARVVWRFRLVVMAGFCFASLLAVLSYVKVGPDGISYRADESWKTYAQLRLELDDPRSAPRGAAGGDAYSLTAVQQQWLAGRAILYSRLASSDRVRALIGNTAAGSGISAAPLPAIDGEADVLPIIVLVGTAGSADGSRTITLRGADALSRFIVAQQRAADDLAVRVSLIRKPYETQLSQGRPKTLPIVVFLTVMLATFGLAFVLENLRPRIRAVGAESVRPAPVASAPFQKSG